MPTKQYGTKYGIYLAHSLKKKQAVDICVTAHSMNLRKKNEFTWKNCSVMKMKRTEFTGKKSTNQLVMYITYK